MPGARRYVYLWEFVVRPGSVPAFERAYGPDSERVSLFRRAEGHVETLLLKDVAQPGRYVTIDRWRSEADFEAFRTRFAGEYRALDERCASLTIDERPLGAYEE